MNGDTQGRDPADKQGHWLTTHWSVILRAQDPSSPHALEALGKLCQAYWYPLYAYARRKGYDEHCARDLTQGFFARLLEKNYLAQVNREKGKFRAFLLVAFKHFIADQRDRETAQKRGGAFAFEPLEARVGEERYIREPADLMDPEKLYAHRWALTLLEQSRAQLKQEYVAAGKAELYEQLQRFEAGEHDTPAYAEIAPQLGLSEGGLRTAVFRMRQRYRELIREEVTKTVNDISEVDEELRYLMRAVSIR